MNKQVFIPFVLLLISLFSMPVFAQEYEYGTIKIIAPTESCTVIYDKHEIPMKGKELTINASSGSHDIIVKSKDEAILYSDSLDVGGGKTIVIDVSSEKPLSQTQSQPNPSQQTQLKQNQVKRFIIRPLYNFAHTINVNVSNNDYMGSGLRATYNVDFDVDAGVGLAIEGIVWQGEGNRSESLLGVSYFQGNSQTMNGKGTLTTYPAIYYRNVSIDAKGAFTSLYYKWRYFLAERNKMGNNTYLGTKLSYNMMQFSGDFVGTSNLWGYGLFMGFLFNEDYDLEIAFDTTQGSIDNFDDGYDTLKGTFTMQNVLSVSLGYMF